MGAFALRERHRVRRCIACGFAALLALAVVMVGWGAFAGRFLDGPFDEPVQADLIVVLGGDTGKRVRRGLQLYQQGLAPDILVVGLEGWDEPVRSHRLDWSVRELIDAGVPQAHILSENASKSSWDEAVNTAKLMKSRNMKRVLVVSNPPHMRRLAWVWGKVFKDTGMEYRLIPTSMPQWKPDRWWHDSLSAQYVISEHIKLAYYLINH